MVCLRLRDNGHSSSEMAVCLRGLSWFGWFGLGVKYCEPGPTPCRQVSGSEVGVPRTFFPGPVLTKDVDMPYLES
jgi:hypothetical protein